MGWNAIRTLTEPVSDSSSLGGAVRRLRSPSQHLRVPLLGHVTQKRTSHNTEVSDNSNLPSNNNMRTTPDFDEPPTANKNCVYWGGIDPGCWCVYREAVFSHLTWFRIFFSSNSFSEHLPQQHPLFTSCLLFGSRLERAKRSAGGPSVLTNPLHNMETRFSLAIHNS